MKKTTILLTLLAMWTLTFAGKVESAKWEKIDIHTSAVCEMCEETIEGALAYAKGVRSAHLDVPSKVVTIVYNPAKTDPLTLRGIISASGYDADDVPAQPEAYNKLENCCKKGVSCAPTKK